MSAHPHHSTKTASADNTGTLRPVLEIAVQDSDGAALALRNGADRLELCQALSMGGLTPSVGLLEHVLSTSAAETPGPDVHVLIRPRPGGFEYTRSELETMVRDVEAAARAGAAGVVIGALCRPDAACRARLDSSALHRLIAAARGVNPGIELTLHRCIDVLLGEIMGVDAVDVGTEGTSAVAGDGAAATVPAERRAACAELLAEVRDLGFTRVLTSGGAARSIDGLPVLRLLRQLAGPGLQIQVGGGVRPEDIPQFVEFDGVHLSARSSLTRGASGPGGGVEHIDVTNGAIVRAARAALG